MAEGQWIVIGVVFLGLLAWLVVHQDQAKRQKAKPEKENSPVDKPPVNAPRNTTQTTKSNQPRLDRLHSLDLSAVVRRVMNKFSWTEEYAKNVERDYRNFLSMVINGAYLETILVAPEWVAQFWQEHRCIRRQYARDCQHIFGERLCCFSFQHYPNPDATTHTFLTWPGNFFAKTNRIKWSMHYAEFPDSAKQRQEFLARFERQHSEANIPHQDIPDYLLGKNGIPLIPDEMNPDLLPRFEKPNTAKVT